ncbi:UDP-N-acetylmuramoyl-L-alanine--D-glutamate ligase [Balneolaceae bacterium ANBcel3]|nr:UDP-N-acetylmuramoyl-L-alanine--D-glutamate ligase [Balneolaceae bacterium ANBcel3]
MNSVNGKHIVIAGAARSGVAVAELLARKGAHVLVSDSGCIATKFRKRLTENHILFEEGVHSEASFEGDMLVLSPGVPSDAAIVRAYLERNCPVFSEIEVASWFCKSKIIAVTGSNGKTTVVNWLADVWKRAGRPYLLAGNVGTAFSEVVDQTSEEVDVILEVSSFQLDHIDRFRARVGVILNITPDHLNRYQNQFENYVRSKMNLPKNQTTEDSLIYGYDDPVVKKQMEAWSDQKKHPALLPFSIEVDVPGACLRDGILRIQTGTIEEDILSMKQIALPGNHNLRNGLAVALAARICEIDKDYIRESLSSFEGVPHRLQKVRDLEGVEYYNDSKATNVNAVWYALSSFRKPLVLIMGGRDKGNDYSELKKELLEKARAIIAIGEGKEAIREQLKDAVPMMLEAETMSDAVQKSYRIARSGDVVLLSPACASFDMFESYEDRGLKFIQAVMAL